MILNNPKQWQVLKSADFHDFKSNLFAKRKEQLTKPLNISTYLSSVEAALSL